MSIISIWHANLNEKWRGNCSLCTCFTVPFFLNPYHNQKEKIFYTPQKESLLQCNIKRVHGYKLLLYLSSGAESKSTNEVFQERAFVGWLVRPVGASHHTATRTGSIHIIIIIKRPTNPNAFDEAGNGVLIFLCKSDKRRHVTCIPSFHLTVLQQAINTPLNTSC